MVGQRIIGQGVLFLCGAEGFADFHEGDRLKWCIHRITGYVDGRLGVLVTIDPPVEADAFLCRQRESGEWFTNSSAANGTIEKENIEAARMLMAGAIETYNENRDFQKLRAKMILSDLFLSFAPPWH